jgi:hypothetical protein
MSARTAALDAAAHAREVDILVGDLRALFDGRDAHVLICSLEEMYARVLSACIHDSDEVEKALEQFQRHVRGWWVADRGGSFRPQ